MNYRGVGVVNSQQDFGVHGRSSGRVWLMGVANLMAEESFAVLSVSESDDTILGSSSVTSITCLSFITSSSEALYLFSSNCTASATVGKGLPRCILHNLSPGKRS